MKNNKFYSHRLYTGPKDQLTKRLSSPAYRKVMENNVDFELSFNDWDVSIEKTLKEHKRVFFSHSQSRAKSNCQVNSFLYKFLDRESFILEAQWSLK